MSKTSLIMIGILNGFLIFFGITWFLKSNDPIIPFFTITFFASIGMFLTISVIFKYFKLDKME